MQVNLSKSELELIDTALTAWEKEAQQSAMTGSLLGVMLSGLAAKSEDDAERRAETASERARITLEKADAEMRRRRNIAILLRAKLIQAASVASEHEIDRPCEAEG